MAEDWKLDRAVTEPLAPEDEALEARVRMKLDLHVPLMLEERTFFLHMRADKGLRPRG